MSADIKFDTDVEDVWAAEKLKERSWRRSSFIILVVSLLFYGGIPSPFYQGPTVPMTAIIYLMLLSGVASGVISNAGSNVWTRILFYIGASLVVAGLSLALVILTAIVFL